MTLEQRMAGGVQAQPVGRNGGGDAVVVAGKARTGEKSIDEGKDPGAFDKGLGIAADLAC